MAARMPDHVAGVTQRVRSSNSGSGIVLAMREKQVLHGRLEWLSPDKGGLAQPIPLDRWIRPAWIEPGSIARIASLVITEIIPGARVSSNVSAFWLFWETLPDDDWRVEPGNVLAIAEGVRAVAYLHVDLVEEAVEISGDE
jgi:hypothetical protein